jgi:predicted ATPase with chaperone activity
MFYKTPCPCGYAGDGEKTCTCSPSVVTRYQKRISGPLLDRIDIHVEVPRVSESYNPQLWSATTIPLNMHPITSNR